MKRSNPTLRSSARGSSLIEVMISMVILAIGILGVMQMAGLAAGQNGLATRQSAAAFIGRDLVDAVERLPYNHPALAVACGNTATQLIYDQASNTLNTSWGPGEVPVLSATPAILNADQDTGAMVAGVQRVWWDVTCDEETPGGYVFGKNVLITVRVRTPGGGTRDLHFWTQKYNPQKLCMSPTGDCSGFQEI